MIRFGLKMSSWLALIICSTVIAEENVGQWLERMRQAVQQQNYRGVFVYSHDNIMETMEVYHRGGINGGVERLISLDGTPREIIRSGESVTCILPDRSSIRIDRSKLHRSPLSVAELKQDIPLDTYQMEVARAGRIAGHETQLISVLPRDEFRYGYRVWVHAVSALPLKTEIVGPNGVVLESVLFTSLNIVEHLPDELLEPSLKGERLTWLESPNNVGELTKSSSIPPWQIDSLPAKFWLKSKRVQLIPGRPKAAEHHLFTDGLAVVSVYVEPTNGMPPHLGAAQMGAINFFGAILEGLQITVLGDVPPITVRQFANAVRLTKQ